MINLLIWSKDRPCQLDALIRSTNCYFDRIIILYKASAQEYIQGFQKLQDKYKNYPLTFIEEGNANFGMLTKFLVKECVEYVCLSTDDTIMYQKPPIPATEVCKLICNDTITFSFRYGFNTIVQNCHTGQTQPFLNNPTQNNNIISWNFSHYHPHDNYGYPFGLDMHVYNSEVLSNLIQDIDFNNTNQLETGLFHKRNIIPKIIKSFTHSAAVNVPCNSISGVTRAGEQHPMTIEGLNNAWLDGYILDLSVFNNIKIVGCHQEINWKLIKDE